MIGNANKNFIDVVVVGKMIENGVKLGKIENEEENKLTSKRKEGETYAMSYQRKAYNPSNSQQSNYAY